MIKFFRKIRQQLLKENRFSKYMLYALGEIILVVIGILIALAISNWNETQKSKKLEQQLLHALLAEFESNLQLLNDVIALNNSNIENSILLGEYTGPSVTNIHEKELSERMVGIFKIEPRYLPNQGTVQEIINSGRLSVLSDDKLRKALSAWQSGLESVKRQENYVVERRDIGHDFFLKEGNFRRHLDLINDALLDPTPSKFPNNDFKFLENQEFESQLYLFIVASRNLNVVFYEPLRERINTIIALIKNDIQ
ncbi:DUF6090 family protein [Maribacter cobaltidurans]|uniref:Uncharacterized protein n=1 Tax=Maribacter cobaltidurans TaxID=1178778 RepID=A0A223V8S9_9FLAO|nr:DUF6090 family protein [Maribacter cobaltidurans]ASV31804.1 hypothetical protein CJ263_17155 [Maribacter cobaltidurans]GGD84733.1 hypothetical protein GCM10011412_23090 [Maribacter cobaltidurans]